MGDPIPPEVRGKAEGLRVMIQSFKDLEAYARKSRKELEGQLEKIGGANQR